MNYIPNNLDQFRKRSTFNHKTLYQFLFPEDISLFRVKVQEEIKKYPILFTYSATASLDEKKRLSCQRMSILRQLKNKFNHEITSSGEYQKVWFSCLWNLHIPSVLQYIINVEMVPNVIKSLGTKRHLEYYEKILNGEYISSFALTEIGHGSNAKGIQTTATYDKNTQEFVLNSPNFKAAKCWIGNLGKIGTHSAVYAQLITPDGINHGLHTFIVEVRDPKTHEVHPRIIVCDIGEKIELNGIDNSVLIFDQYRIPRENLLNRLHDVSIDGRYVRYPEIKNSFAFSLGILSNGRMFITNMGSYQLSCTIAIAIRYLAAKKHCENKLFSLLEDQTYQVRLFPYLALTYVTKISTDQLLMLQNKFYTDLTTHGFSKMGEEIHAIVSAAKPIVTWSVLDGIRECLYACGEYSCLIDSGLGSARNMYEVNCTYEGENTVLIQQTSNWLLKQWSLKLTGKNITLPLSSINYINDASKILKETFEVTMIEEFIKPRNILSCYKWLVCYLLKRCHEKQQNIIKVNNKSEFWAKNDSQVFFCRNLGFAYIQAFMIRETDLAISTMSDVHTQKTLNKLLSLFGIWNLQKYITSFYEGGYAASSNFVKIIEDAILFLCKDIQNDAVSLVDVIAPPDEFINATIGRSDGQVYTNILSSLSKVSDVFSRSC